MKADIIRQRVMAAFILIEFVKGELGTTEKVGCMLNLVQKKLGMSKEQAGEFIRGAIGLKQIQL